MARQTVWSVYSRQTSRSATLLALRHASRWNRHPRRILDAAQAIVLERGFAATSVDAVLAAAPATKGAFFHHFPSKNELGRALLERYAAGDERRSTTPWPPPRRSPLTPPSSSSRSSARFEQASGDPRSDSARLPVRLVHLRAPVDPADEDDVIAASIRLWRDRLLAKLEAAAAVHPPVADVDLGSLADQVFTVFEGGFILVRATGDPTRCAHS